MIKDQCSVKKRSNAFANQQKTFPIFENSLNLVLLFEFHKFLKAVFQL